ncbi:hypothetical protein ACOBR2_13950 [Telmatobacter bradus]|uniref:hypothetical protein n=1 Tax=Telmatobacter bradus TaxID=474953 RepID=UPI003B42E480
MVVVPLTKAAEEPADALSALRSLPWTRIAAAGTLIASGGLLLSGRRKAGLLAATTGVSLALLDQQKNLQDWWRVLPGYISDVQRILDQAQDAIDDVSATREKVAQIIEQIRPEEARG